MGFYSHIAGIVYLGFQFLRAMAAGILCVVSA
jgi:hypothetical protein